MRAIFIFMVVYLLVTMSTAEWSNFKHTLENDGIYISGNMTPVLYSVAVDLCSNRPDFIFFEIKKVYVKVGRVNGKTYYIGTDERIATKRIRKSNVSIQVQHDDHIVPSNYEDLHTDICVNQQVLANFTVVGDDGNDWKRLLTDLVWKTCKNITKGDSLILQFEEPLYIKHVIGRIVESSYSNISTGWQSSTNMVECSRTGFNNIFIAECNTYATFMKILVRKDSQVCDLSVLSVNTECLPDLDKNLEIDWITYTGETYEDIYTAAVDLCSSKRHFVLFNNTDELQVKLSRRNVRFHNSTTYYIHTNNSSYRQLLKDDMGIGTCNVADKFGKTSFIELFNSMCAQVTVSDSFYVLGQNADVWEKLTDRNMDTCIDVTHDDSLILQFEKSLHIKHVIGVISKWESFEVHIGEKCVDSIATSATLNNTDIAWTVCASHNPSGPFLVSSCNTIGSYVMISLLHDFEPAKLCEVSVIAVNVTGGSEDGFGACSISKDLNQPHTDVTSASSSLQPSKTDMPTISYPDYESNIPKTSLKRSETERIIHSLDNTETNMPTSLQGYKTGMPTTFLKDYEANILTTSLQDYETDQGMTSLQSAKTDIPTTSLQSYETEQGMISLQSSKTDIPTTSLQSYETEQGITSLQSSKTDIPTTSVQGFETGTPTTSLKSSETNPGTTPLETSEIGILTTSTISIQSSETGISTTSFQSLSSISTSITPAPIGFDHRGRAVRSKCICRCRDPKAAPYNMTGASRKIEAIQKSITVNTQNLTKTIQRKISQKDGRTSSQAFGVLGIVLMTLPITAFVLSDVFHFLYLCFSRVSKKPGTNK